MPRNQNDPTRQGASSDDTKIEQNSTPESEQEEQKPPLSGRDAKMAELLAAQRDTPDTEAVTHPEERARLEAEQARRREETESEESDEADSGADEENRFHVDQQEEGVDNRESGADDDGNEATVASKSQTDLPVYLKDGVPHVKLKINGEEREMRWDKVQSIAQKNVLADDRLRRVADKEKQLQSREEQLAQREQQIQERLAHLPAQGVEQDESSIEQAAQDFIDGLFDGTKEEAVQKSAAFLRRMASTPQQDLGALTQQAVEAAKAEARSVLEQRDAAQHEQSFNDSMRRGFTAVSERYPSLLEDDVLFDMVDRRTESIAAAEPDLEPEQVIQRAAEEVAERLNLKARGTQSEDSTIPPASGNSRQERKEQLKPVPASRIPGARQPRQEEKPVDNSPKAVIDRMAQSREALARRQ